MIRVDTSQLKTFATALRKTAPDLFKEFGAGLRAGGLIIAEDAKQRANFSTRIPPSIKVRRSGVSVKIIAGGDTAPEAAPLENQGQSGTFRHPVFGNFDVWVNQQARPFLAPAVEANEEAVVVQVLATVDGTFRKLGF